MLDFKLSEYFYGVFAVDPEKGQLIRDFPIMPIERLETFVLENNIMYGIITLPTEAA